MSNIIISNEYFPSVGFSRRFIQVRHLVDPYRIVTVQKPKIGKGKFGKVNKATYGNRVVALKKMIFSELEENKKAIIKEIFNLRFAECEQIPKFYGLWKGKKGKRYHLVFDFLEGNTL